MGTKCGKLINFMGTKWGWGQMEQINKFYGGQNGDGGKWGWGQINKF